MSALYLTSSGQLKVPEVGKHIALTAKGFRVTSYGNSIYI